MADLLIRREQERVGPAHARDADAMSGQQGQAGERTVVANCDFAREPSADREAGKVDAVETEMIEQVEIEIGEVADIIEPARRVRTAEARMLGDDDIEMLGELGEKRRPGGSPVAAMKIDERRALPVAHDARL